MSSFPEDRFCRGAAHIFSGVDSISINSVLLLAWHFLVYKISHELVGGLEPNLY